MKTFDGLCNVNIELTDRCNKNCWMCGRREREKKNPRLITEYGDIDFELLKSISNQLPEDIVIQLHNNGEPLLYEHFGYAVDLFSNQITSITTNGKLLMEKQDEIIGRLDTMAISIIEKDSESWQQYRIIKEFLELKGKKKPFVVSRLLGEVHRERYEVFGIPIATRILHNPMGSFDYKKNPVIPEIGICLDFLNHLSINRKGEVSICVRYDPERLGVIGNANKDLLVDIWNGKKRMEWLDYHKQGCRYLIPLCSRCHFWGVPTGS